MPWKMRSAFYAPLVAGPEKHRWLDGVYSIEDVASSQKSDLVTCILSEHQLTEAVVVGD
ncbi:MULTISPECIES: hypothetical protein [Exiguobacterium]|uniref:hypothetical protein n=1 Tax=Exiguobacterium TaxID=33986 RepID=UPI0028AF327C|nr:hypothetical protein [Exiguobacterium soli]